MKFCQPHWDDLRAAINDRGLSSLVARDGRAAARRTVAELKGTADLSTYDPLMAAHWAIAERAMSQPGGVQALMFGTGPECPLCFVQQHHDNCKQPSCAKEMPAEWITGCTDSILAFCRENGLVVVS